MSTLPSAFAKVTIEESQVGSAGTNGLAQNIGQASNWVVENAKPSPVGSIKYSELTLAQFQAVAGTGWVLASGQALLITDQLRILTGFTVVPDLTGSGAFVRGVAGIETIIDTSAPSANPSHTHAIVQANNVAKWNGVSDREATVGGPVWKVGVLSFIGTPTAGSGGGPAAEFRPKSVVMNAFIRIN